MPTKIDIPPQEEPKDTIVCSCDAWNKNSEKVDRCASCGHHFNDHIVVDERGDYLVGRCKNVSTMTPAELLMKALTLSSEELKRKLVGVPVHLTATAGEWLGFRREDNAKED